MGIFFALAALLVIYIAFLIFSAVIFYHIGRYSFVGDYSKRYSLIFLAAGTIITFMALILVVINHL